MTKHENTRTREHENNKIKSGSGFTLIELLVAISIIGMLAGLLLPNFMGARQRARDTQRKQDLMQIKKALRLYYNDYQAYPTSNVNNEIVGCGAGGDEVCSWGSEFSDGSSTVYMKELPVGPSGSTDEPEYSYSRDALNSDDFELLVPLENESDPDMETSQENCGVGTTAPEYVVCAD
ncbi:type II secretion system protein [Candidatus Microgenomates bacterium]|nr:type II secretion system protein [Candidatus Microgenomates bacterium]